MHCIELYATWLPDVEEPKIGNTENIINKLKTVKIGDEK